VAGRARLLTGSATLAKSDIALSFLPQRNVGLSAIDAKSAKAGENSTIPKERVVAQIFSESEFARDLSWL
jgi:hypothetical protein